MHRFADRVVAAEGKGNVAHPAADFRPGTLIFDFPYRFDEGHSVVSVLVNPGCQSQDIRIENDVLRGNPDLFRQQLISSLQQTETFFSNDVA